MFETILNKPSLVGVKGKALSNHVLPQKHPSRKAGSAHYIYTRRYIQNAYRLRHKNIQHYIHANEYFQHETKLKVD
jgi:hypothetical protein